MAKKENKSTRQFYNVFTKYFSLIIFVVVVLVLLIFYFFLINPKLQATTQEIQEDINFQQNIWGIERQKLLEMQESLDYFRQINDNDVQFLESVIPRPYPKEKLFGQMEDIVLINGYTLNNLNLEKIEFNIEDQEGEDGEIEQASDQEILMAENLQIISISMGISGLNYNGMKRFLEVLQNQLPLMDIVNLDFSPESESLSLNIYTYYFKP